MSYPILYSATERTFDTNGLGIMSDAVSCTVTEERNSLFELEMQYPVDGIHFADLALQCILLAKPNPVDRAQPFRIYRITTPMSGTVTVYAQHISYDLSGIPASPFTASSAAEAMSKLSGKAAATCPFTFWTDKGTKATMTVSIPTSIRSLLGGMEGSVLDVYGGGEYKFDRFDVKLYGNRGANRGVTIRYGKNLTSLEQEQNCASVCTGVYPYWADTDGNVFELPEKILKAEGTFAVESIATLDMSSEWEEKPTESQLRERAKAYIKANNITVPKVSLTVSHVQLEQTDEYKGKALLERVELCDTVNIEFAKLGVSATAKAIEMTYNVLLNRIESISFGDAKRTLADTLRDQQAAMDASIQQSARDTRTHLQKAVDNATAQITGNMGGYVVLHSSTGQKEPDEILIMDTPSIDTAVHVWRWNKAGLGYSSKGYNGPYGTAITADGHIVADYMDTGTLDAAEAEIVNLNANNITTGTLSADRIAAGSIDASKISVNDLQALGATIGGWTIGDGLKYNDGAFMGGFRPNSDINVLYIGYKDGSGEHYPFVLKRDGSIKATSGRIGGFDISEDDIHSKLTSFSGKGNGVYIGTDGINLGGKFTVDNQGNLTASSGTFTGNVSAKNIMAGGDNGYITGDKIGAQTVGPGNLSESYGLASDVSTLYSRVDTLRQKIVEDNKVLVKNGIAVTELAPW